MPFSLKPDFHMRKFQLFNTNLVTQWAKSPKKQSVKVHFWE